MVMRASTRAADAATMRRPMRLLNPPRSGASKLVRGSVDEADDVGTRGQSALVVDRPPADVPLGDHEAAVRVDRFNVGHMPHPASPHHRDGAGDGDLPGGAPRGPRVAEPLPGVARPGDVA